MVSIIKEPVTTRDRIILITDIANIIVDSEIKTGATNENMLESRLKEILSILNSRSNERLSILATTLSLRKGTYTLMQ